MVTRNVGLLLDNASAPAAGIDKSVVVQWYGGNLSLVTSGVFDGATVELMACTRLPHSGDRLEYLDPTKFSDADFTPLASVTEPGTQEMGNINPCALAVRITNPGGNTRIKARVA